jgi:hypothetical protein
MSKLLDPSVGAGGSIAFPQLIRWCSLKDDIIYLGFNALDQENRVCF